MPFAARAALEEPGSAEPASRKRNRILSGTQRRQQPQQGRKPQTAQSQTQETLHGINGVPSGEHSQV